MKKLLSIVMVLTLVLSLGVMSASAENTGSITITNATIDETYAVYKIFDASIKLATDGSTEAVSYSIKQDNQFFAALFGADGTANNDFFVYNANTGSVTKKEGVNDSELIKYLTELVKNGSYQTAADPIKAASDEVVFDDLPYGYYLITSTLGTTVTINSNTPDVEVIDKNQEPASTSTSRFRLVWMRMATPSGLTPTPPLSALRSPIRFPSWLPTMMATRRSSTIRFTMKRATPSGLSSTASRLLLAAKS